MEHLLSLLKQMFRSDELPASRLIRLSTDRPVVFVGDIHGDRVAVDTVFSRFPPPDYGIVFLGDIVDRGFDSLGALTRIVAGKQATPDCVHLLMGNHEARGIQRFSPADFWDGLPQDQSEELAQHLTKLPLAAWHPAGVLATHGALPEVSSLRGMEDVELGSTAWRALTWGDWVDEDRRETIVGSRPAFGPTAFERRASALGITAHIRSHQPSAPTYLFADRCLTLFTSVAYGDGIRRVARLAMGKQVETARDLELIEL